MKRKTTKLLSGIAAVMLIPALVAGAAEADSPFKLSGTKEVVYCSDEQKITFTDKNTVEEIADFLNNSGAVKVDVNPNTPMGVSFTVNTADRNYYYTVSDQPYSEGRTDLLFADGEAYKTEADMGELVDMMQDKLGEADPYGYFCPYSYGGARLLDNTARQAVASVDKNNEIAKHLAKLNPKQIAADKTKLLGKRLDGCSEIRLTLSQTDDTLSYQVYEKGISVTRYTSKGAGKTEYFLCDTAAVKELHSSMKKLYDNDKTKSASWLAIINSSRVKEIKTSFGAEQKNKIRPSYIRQITEELKAINVGKVKTVNGLWKTPDAECEMKFTTGIGYRVQLLGGRMRIYSSDMKQILEYTIDKDDSKEVVDWLKLQTTKSNSGEEKPNPETAKPVIYLYPQKQTEVNVKLDFLGNITSTYPHLTKEGWTVTAAPDGTLTDKEGRSYRYLFWEGVADTDWTQESGFFVKADEAEKFLEEKLTLLGLNQLEQNDFITYWLPKLQKNGESFVSFAGKEYTDLAKLDISPEPDSVIRVQMVFTKVDGSNRAELAKLPKQKLESVERKGFVVVEWGGTEI